jgi:alpha-galactosidase
MTRSFLFLIGTLVLVPFAYAKSYVHVLKGNERWEIGNDSVARTLSFSTGHGLRTESLIYKQTGHDFTAYGRTQNRWGDEFNLRAGQQRISGASVELINAGTKDIQGGKILQLDFAAKDKSLNISVFYAAYDGFPAIRKWIGVTNRTTSPVTITNLCFESLVAAPGTPAQLVVTGGYGGSGRDLFFTGRASDAAIFIRNSASGEGFAIINEAPGYLKRTEIGEGWTERFRVMYDTDLFPFEKTLAPGASFESAKSSLVFFLDGHGLEDSHWAVPGYAAHVIMRRPGRGPAPWIYNTWEPFTRTINEEKLNGLAPIAHEMGIDIFTIDDGWQSEYGSNDVDTERFPGGFSGIHDVLSKNNLKLGLWVPLAAVSTNAPAYKDHPEWVCRDSKGNPKFTGTASGQRAVMCLGTPYRDSALKRLEDLISRYHPAYIKVDLTTVFNTYGEQPGCYAKGHFHQDWAESLTDIYAGLEYIGQKLYQSHPEVLVDYTFELWGEKHLIDAALIENADLDWLSNVNDDRADVGGPIHARQLLYERASSIPAETMLVGNLQADVGSVEDRFATETGAAPILLGDLRKLSRSNREWYADKIAQFKQLRSRSDLLDSFFPLGNWSAPRETTWDGFARLSRTAGGVIALFKNESNTASVKIQIAAPPGAHYKVQSLITGASLGEVSSNQLSSGWDVSFPAQHRVEVLGLERMAAR